ncbi:MAG: hypothetical protein Kow0037_22160 [Calditrichia bacterium]
MSSVGVVLQARTGSSRLPKKMLLPIGGVPALEFLLNRLKKLPDAVKIIVATTTEPEDDALAEIAERCGVGIYRGAVNNVMERFWGAAQKYSLDTVIRICGDNVLMEMSEISRMIDIFQQSENDYMANSLPDGTHLILTGTGLAVEIFRFTALQKAINSPLDNYHKEHVTPYFYENPGLFKIAFSPIPFQVYPKMRLTMDLPEDYGHIQAIIEAVGSHITISEINRYLHEHPDMLKEMSAIAERQKKGR